LSCALSERSGCDNGGATGSIQNPAEEFVMPNDNRNEDFVVGGFDLVHHTVVTTTEAERTLLARPRVSIRRRLALMFALFALGSVVITSIVWILLFRIERKIELIGVADQLNYEILQARRFEKNFLLSGSDLEHVEYHIDAANAALDQSTQGLETAVSRDCLDFLEVNLWHYRELIGKLRRIDKEGKGDTSASREEILDRLQSCGSSLISCGQQIGTRERESVRRLLAVSRLIPAVYLLLVISLSVYAAIFMWRHIMKRLELLMAAARRIGAGDFSPIVPIRRSRDEFTDLAVAINRMTRELERREESLLQSQKLRAVGSLTAGIAHEVNNPINNIMLTASVLEEDFDSLPRNERQELIGDIVEQAERAQKIVRNLLDFARESEISAERLKIKDVVQNAVNLAANQLKLSGVRLAHFLPNDMPEINGDRQYLSQVFLNLIVNATDAMGDGGTLTITGDVSLDAGCIAIHIEDTGPGMSHSVQKAIFDPFFTTKASGSGTGLGLSVSLGIVQKHGGEIKVESKVGEGSRFTVILPTAGENP
jgi:signal transduction histidine kinase